MVQDKGVADEKLEKALSQVARALGVARDRFSEQPAARGAERNLREMAADGGCGRQDPVRTILAFVGDRWCALLMQTLAPQPLRFSALRKLIGIIAVNPISTQMLTLKLRHLERDGFVVRSSASAGPPHVMYSLTPLGLQFADKLTELVEWARSTIPDVRAARDRFREENFRAVPAAVNRRWGAGAG